MRTTQRAGFAGAVINGCELCQVLRGMLGWSLRSLWTRTCEEYLTKMSLTPEQKACINKYLRTGNVDHFLCPWLGGLVSGGAAQHKALRQALVVEVTKRTKRKSLPDMPEMDLIAFTRKKIEPMVSGLFPAIERERILQVLQNSVVFLTPKTFASVLTELPYDSTAWTLANLYLLSAGADLLAEDAPRIVGLSSETTCFVSLDYFHNDDKFADFIVHEAAHVFHNSKRERLGLPFTRRREFLLDIDFHQRETFAYACEAYSRILELGKNQKERIALLAEMEDEYSLTVDEVDKEKYVQALRAAVNARNGWKQILEVCAPEPMPSMKEFNRRLIEEFMAKRNSQ